LTRTGQGRLCGDFSFVSFLLVVAKEKKALQSLGGIRIKKKMNSLYSI
jgi:hypothetical protein